jgi:hypothetical protein
MIRWFKELLFRRTLTTIKHPNYHSFKLRGVITGTEIHVFYKNHYKEIYTVEYLYGYPKIVLYNPTDNFTNKLYIYKGFDYEFLFNEVNKHILESL